MDGIDHVATPELFTEDDPRTAPLMRKETVPVGTPDVDVTFAVRVTDWPSVIGFGETASAVVVLVACPGLAIPVIAPEVEAAKVLVAAYCEVRV
jgi:hypothetical protein